MIPVDFVSSNSVLAPPKGREDSVRSLPCWRGETQHGPMVVSCWEMTEHEAARVAETRRVWFGASGVTHPPVMISGTCIVEGFEDGDDVHDQAERDREDADAPTSHRIQQLQVLVHQLEERNRAAVALLARLWDTGVEVNGRHVLIAMDDLGEESKRETAALAAWITESLSKNAPVVEVEKVQDHSPQPAEDR